MGQAEKTSSPTNSVCRLCIFLRVCVRLHVYPICFQENLVKGFEMQVSTRRKVCLWGAQANVPLRRFQAPWMALFSSPHSGRSWWEELEERPQSYEPETPLPLLHKNETRCDKLLHPCHSTLLPFLSLPRFRSSSAEDGQKKGKRKKRVMKKNKKKRKKKTPPASAFYNLCESLTTAISHDKVSN